jgi:hypothetical protein
VQTRWGVYERKTQMLLGKNLNGWIAMPWLIVSQQKV